MCINHLNVSTVFTRMRVHLRVILRVDRSRIMVNNNNMIDRINERKEVYICAYGNTNITRVKIYYKVRIYCIQ